MRVLFVTHPEVTIDPAVPVPEWGLSPVGCERMRAFCGRPELDGITHVHASAERKAREAAGMLAGLRGLPVSIDPHLGENDRSSTGYIAPPRFWEVVDCFFAEPETSVLGWERAVDAQARIGAAVRECIAARLRDGSDSPEAGDLCIVSHGGVGTLLLCDLLGEPITHRHGQPIAGGGCFFAFDAQAWTLEHGWRDIVP